MAGKRKRAWRWALLVALFMLIGGRIGAWLALRTPRGQAAFNIVEYRIRVLWSQWFGEKADAGVGGAISGIVQDESGEPIVGATVLVSTVKGFTYHAESDDLGTFRIEDVPPGRYVVAAGKWGYDNAVYRQGSEERSQIVVRADQLTSGVDITIHEHQPWQPTLEGPAGHRPTADQPCALSSRGLRQPSARHLYQRRTDFHAEHLPPALVYTPRPTRWSRTTSPCASTRL